MLVLANESSSRPDALFIRHLINMVLSNILFCQVMSITFVLYGSGKHAISFR
jgi:hypothetical protein